MTIFGRFTSKLIHNITFEGFVATHVAVGYAIGLSQSMTARGLDDSFDNHIFNLTCIPVLVGFIGATAPISYPTIALFILKDRNK